MNRLIKFSVEHPISILMYFLLTIILGAISVFALNISFLPAVQERHILITTEYAGVNASEVQTLITVPLEDALSSLKGIKNCESVTREGLSLIKAEMKFGTDIDLALVEAKSIIDATLDTLPQYCPKPNIQKLNLSQNEKIKICVVPKNGGICLATNFCKEEFKTKLLELEGIAEIKTFGTQGEEIQIIVDRQKAAFFGIALEDIAQILNCSNYEYPAGTIQSGENDILLKTQGLYKNFGDILQTPIKCNDGGVLKLCDFATVQKVSADFDSFCFYNTERCVQVEIVCKSSYSPIKLSAKINSLLTELNKTYADKFAFAVTEDASRNIGSSIKSLLLSAAAGVVITLLLLCFFFGSKKIAVLIASVIPFSILFTLFVLLATGRSVNLISLSGITICLGMIIDNSIVAVLSVASELRLSMENDIRIEGGVQYKDFSINGKRIEAALAKITLSNSASTLTTIIVFIPLLFMNGILGALFADLAITIIAGMVFSLLFSFTVIPAASVLFLQNEFPKMKSDVFKKLEEKYCRALNKTLPIKILPAAIVGVSILASVLFALPLKKELQPKTAQDNFCVQINFSPATSIKKIFSQSQIIISEIKSINSVKNILAFGGENFTELINPEVFSERIVLQIQARDIKNCKAQVEKVLCDLELKYNFIETQDLISNHLAIKSDEIFSVDGIKNLHKEASEYFSGFIPNYFTDGILFSFDAERLGKHSLSRTQIASAVKNSIEGIECFPYYENGKEVPLKIQFEKTQFDSERKLNNLAVFAREGVLPLATLGNFQNAKNEAILYRYNKKDSKIIPLAEQTKIKSLPETLRKNNIVSLKEKSLQEIFSSGALLLVLVLALLYCLLGAQSESFTLPLIFLLALPPAFFGAIFSLLAFWRSLNINSILALVVLFGTSVNNSIILCEQSVQNAEKSSRPLGIEGGIVENAVSKLSVILATTITSIAALIPFAFVFPSKNPQSSMSLAIIGGLAVSMFAVLLIVPNVLAQSKRSNKSAPAN